MVVDGLPARLTQVNGSLCGCHDVPQDVLLGKFVNQDRTSEPSGWSVLPWLSLVFGARSEILSL